MFVLNGKPEEDQARIIPRRKRANVGEVKVKRHQRAFLVAKDTADRTIRLATELLIEDRERIGRNLHDTVIQRLFAVGMLLQAAVADHGDAVTDRISKAIDEIDATIKEIRTSIFVLATPRRSGLRAEILDVVHDYAERSSFEAHVVFDGPVDTAITGRVQRDLVATVREAVSNASRHALARRVDVSLAVADDVVLEVIDDGVGNREGEKRRSGLANLHARAAALGGSFDVTTTPGSGTILTWRVPLGAAGEEGARDG